MCDTVNIQWIFIAHFPVSFHWFETKWRAFLLADYMGCCPPFAQLLSLSSRGLQFYTFFGISIGITRRMTDIGQKITFYFLQNV
jgi:hypothetical protein